MESQRFIQQVIQGKICDINTRIIISPINRNLKKKPEKHVVSKTVKHTREIEDDYYCGECAEDDLKH